MHSHIWDKNIWLILANSWNKWWWTVTSTFIQEYLSTLLRYMNFTWVRLCIYYFILVLHYITMGNITSLLVLFNPLSLFDSCSSLLVTIQAKNVHAKDKDEVIKYNTLLMIKAHKVLYFRGLWVVSSSKQETHFIWFILKLFEIHKKFMQERTFISQSLCWEPLDNNT